MKSLNHNCLKQLTNIVKEEINDNFVSNITVVNSTDLIFTFSFNRKHKLFVSLNSQAPFMGLVDYEINATTMLIKIQETLRNKLKDSHLIDLNCEDDDRIVKFIFQKPNDKYEKEKYYLFIELIPNRPNLILTNESYEIIFALHTTSLNSKRIILPKFPYQYPVTMKVNNSYIEFSLESYNKEINEYLLTSFKNRLKEKYNKLFVLLNKKLKVSKNKIDVLNKEIKEANNDLSLKEIGTNILTYQYNEDELNQYIKENNINYDHSLTASENANKLFKKYKKAKKTIEMDTIELDKNHLTITELEDELLAFESNDEIKLDELSHKYFNTKLNKSLGVNKKAPYYYEINGTKIAYGKNSEQNDYLSFKIALKGHYFFHIEGYSGSHVILTKDNPTDQDIKYAAETAVLVSKKDIGQVSYCKVSDIKKGKTSGQVLLNKHKSIQVKSISEEVKNGIKKSNRYSF